MPVQMTTTFNKNLLRRAIAKILCSIALFWFGLVAAQSAHAGQAASEPAPVRVGGDVKPPIKTKDVKPVYPSMARQTRIQGVVILEITIGDDGKVKAVKVLKSLALLEAAAVDAVKQWEFKPTLVNGKPTPVIMPVAVNFTLD
jgi:protein TonB